MIGEVITQADLKAMQKANEKNFSSFGFVAPGVFALPNTGVRTAYVHNTLDEAIQQLKFNLKIKGGKDNRKNFITVPDTGNNTAKALFVSVDFFLYIPVLGVIPVSYAAVKQQINKLRYVIIKGYTVSTGAEVYSIVDFKFLGIAATKVTNVSEKKLDALDEFHRQLQIAKARHNALVDYVAVLKNKKMSRIELDMFEEAVTKLEQMRARLKAVPGVNISYGTKASKNAIGVIPVIIWIVVIIAGAVLAGFTIDKILSYLKELKQINGDNDIIKFTEEQRLKIAQSGLSEAKQKELNNALDKTQAAAEKDKAAASADKPGILDGIQNIVFFSGAVYLVSKFIK
jgi:hypothetical protein